ncbi:Ff.00g085160.m01.CDS01 [Fusarium sp. VM40]|nr:Ff.00g085160.m01.CDS01 [Fusarium sp. VM40]
MAHKTLTIHRHFLLNSFSDKRFAYTQLTCVAIAERCIVDFHAWPKDVWGSIACRMWTVSSHLVTCCLIVTFAFLFRRGNELSHNYVATRRLAELGRNMVRQLESSSSIARRGGVLLDVLLRLDAAKPGERGVELDLPDIVRQVSFTEETQEEERLHGTEQFVLQMSSDVWDEIFSVTQFDVTGWLQDVGS